MKGSGIDSATPSFRRNGKVVNAGCVTTFSEYTVASENRVTRIPEQSDSAVASLLGCAVTTGLGIVFNNANLKPGESIAVFGTGGVGLNVLQGALLVSAFPIVGLDLHDHKLEQAKACMTDADCVIISPGCGYGCQLPLNKAVSGDIMSDAGVYGQNCGGDCGPKDCPPPPSLGKDAHGKDIEVVAGCVSNVCKIVQQLSPVTVTPLPERTPVPARRPIPRPMQHP